MPKKNNRKDQIMELTFERGIVSVGDLAERLGVSAQTVRRDINQLCRDNLLRRRHGGVERFEQPLNTPYGERTTTNPDYKHAIAEAVADMVADGSSIFISIGSTPTMVAQALKAKKNLTVITNNLNAAMALSAEVTNRIILPGGELRLPDRDILGDEVTSFFDNYRAEFGIFGVAGVAEDGALLDFHASEVRVREKIRMNCHTSVLVVDSTKFGRYAPAVGGSIFDVDRIIIDKRQNDDYLPLLKRVEDRLVIVGGSTT